MKLSRSAVLAIVAVPVLFLLFALGRSFQSASPLSQPSDTVPLRGRPEAHPSVSERPKSRAQTAPAIPLQPLSLDLEKIETAETPSALGPYLASSSPEVRAAAKDAMLRLGDSAASPMLEAAAVSLPPEEAVSFLEAARFLALPDATGFSNRRHSAAPRSPGSDPQKAWGVGRRMREPQPTPDRP